MSHVAFQMHGSAEDGRLALVTFAVRWALIDALDAGSLKIHIDEEVRREGAGPSTTGFPILDLFCPSVAPMQTGGWTTGQLPVGDWNTEQADLEKLHGRVPLGAFDVEAVDDALANRTQVEKAEKAHKQDEDALFKSDEEASEELLGRWFIFLI